MLNELIGLLGRPSLLPTAEIGGVTHDSRCVNPGDIYVAVRGAHSDGHAFITDAIRSGAAAIVVDQLFEAEFSALRFPGWVVPNTRAVMGLIADIVYQHPSKDMHLVGVTGTNGKTSTTHIIAHLAKSLYKSSGIVGTLGASADGVSIPAQRTTPEAPELQYVFSQMRRQSVMAVAIEVASHALIYGRVNGCLFDAAVFTNLTQDHLDFHGDMETYFQAKSLLFTDHLSRSIAGGKHPFAVVNVSNEWGQRLQNTLDGFPVYSYATTDNTTADLIASNIRLLSNATQFDVTFRGEVVHVDLPLGGSFQVENALAALTWFVGAGGLIPVGAELLHTCPQIPGRFEVVPCKQPFSVVVDYAHTPDGLKNVLETARGLCSGNLICVFGCGGDRDRTKRPKMGEIASRYCNTLVVTSDNPRSENPESIIDDIVGGISGAVQLSRYADRRVAIAQALQVAQTGDVVVIAGKGHETYQIIGDDVFPFDDRLVAAEELSKCI